MENTYTLSKGKLQEIIAEHYQKHKQKDDVTPVDLIDFGFSISADDTSARFTRKNVSQDPQTGNIDNIGEVELVPPNRKVRKIYQVTRDQFARLIRSKKLVDLNMPAF